MATPSPTRPSPDPNNDLLYSFARVHALLSDDYDPMFVVKMKRRLRDEPSFADDLRRAAAEFSILLGSS